MFLIDINVSAEIDEYPSLRFQDIRKKKQQQRVTDGHTDGRTDGRMDNVKTVYPTHTKFAGGIISRDRRP